MQKNLPTIRALNAIARKRGQPLAEMALAWVLRLPAVTSALVGASSIAQLESNVRALNHLDFSREELSEIHEILRGAKALVKLPHPKGAAAKRKSAPFHGDEREEGTSTPRGRCATKR